MDRAKEVMKRLGFREDFDWDNRFMIRTELYYCGEEIVISTVDLGLDHNFYEGDPLYYETAIFNESKLKLPEDLDGTVVERYTTEEEARKGHEEYVQRVKKLINK